VQPGAPGQSAGAEWTVTADEVQAAQTDVPELDAGADLAQMEDALRDSGLDWTVVWPPRLTDKPLTGAYRTAYGQNLRRGLLVSRADVAHLMLGALEQPETIKRTIGIAN
jgi:uncharacterized protein YbjT (DUF2867 family)